jgi:hypothetical protein
MEEGGQYKKEQMRNSTKNVGRERKVFKEVSLNIWGGLESIKRARPERNFPKPDKTWNGSNDALAASGRWWG